MTDDVKMQLILDLEHRVTKLEKEIDNSKQEELEWALNQFRYSKKTSDQSKAFLIIDEALKKK
jgi:hypothetical protein